MSTILRGSHNEEEHLKTLKQTNKQTHTQTSSRMKKLFWRDLCYKTACLSSLCDALFVTDAIIINV